MRALLNPYDITYWDWYVCGATYYQRIRWFTTRKGAIAISEQHHHDRVVLRDILQRHTHVSATMPLGLSHDVVTSLEHLLASHVHDSAMWMEPAIAKEKLTDLRLIDLRTREEHEAVAGRLGLKTPTDPDPYVERLLEGMARLKH